MEINAEAWVTIGVFVLGQVIASVYQRGKNKEQSDAVVNRLNTFDGKIDRFIEKQHEHELEVSNRYLTKEEFERFKAKYTDDRQYISQTYLKEKDLEGKVLVITRQSDDKRIPKSVTGIG